MFAWLESLRRLRTEHENLRSLKNRARTYAEHPRLVALICVRLRNYTREFER